MKAVTVLGSTGSIGVNTLDVIQQHPERFRVIALTANRNVDKLYEQCMEFRPRVAVMADSQAARSLSQRLKAADLKTEVWSGPEALIEAGGLAEADMVMAAIVGGAGLAPTLSAVQAGKTVLLANKEALVMGGSLFQAQVTKHQAMVIPIDSEHNAIFQCLPADRHPMEIGGGVRGLLLTASGGPFRDRPKSDLDSVTPEQAIAHPNWVMGRKISVDSASMMNKGLEVIEACYLFGTEPDRVRVVIHPQSVIHSMVEYVDGSVLAQLGNPDMRTPIAHALAWPERIESGVASLDLFEVSRLDFEPPDCERFPCLQLAFDAARAGHGAPVVLNAANEIAVEAFLDRRIRFTDIPHVIQDGLEGLGGMSVSDLEEVVDLDRRARCGAWDYIGMHLS